MSDLDCCEPASKILKNECKASICSNGIVGRNEADEESPLLRLPKEIWSLVFGYVPQNDLLNHRLVNKKWHENINTLAAFHVVFKDDQPTNVLETLCKLRVRSCEFRCLHKSFVPKLANPGLLKRIIFAPTSSENVKNILTTFTKIESLAFYTLLSLDKHFDPNVDYKDILEQLKCLKEIDIGIHSISERQKQISSIFETLIGNDNIVFPSLKRVRFCFSVCTAEIWKKLFNWLGRHRNTLESLELNCSCLLGSEITEDDLLEINMKNLLSLRLKSLLLCDTTRLAAVHEIYNQLVSAQSSLENVCVNYNGVNVSTYVQVLQKSTSTLRSVKCFNVLLTDRTAALDASLFQNNCLEELVFQCIPTVVCVVLEWDGIRRYSASVVGWQLPKCIKRLHIQGCSVPTHELANFYECNSNSLANLQELILLDVGDSKGYGITLHVFRKICGLMLELKVFKLNTIYELVSKNSEDDTEVWKQILEHGQMLKIYEAEEEDNEIVHVFNFVNRENRQKFLIFLDQLSIDSEISECIPEPDIDTCLSDLTQTQPVDKTKNFNSASNLDQPDATECT